MNIFKLPDLGEGLPEAEIVEWLISEGDSVTTDQILVSMETAKAIVEIPSPSTGVVTKLYGRVGDIILTGDPLLEFALADTTNTETTNPANTETTNPANTASNSVVGELSTDRKHLKERPQASAGSSHLGVKATPAVRALAKRMDIDLSVITPSGPDGTIKAGDVERVAKIYAQVGQLQPLKGVRRAMAKTMAQAHLEVVPVTIIDDADIHLWPQYTDVTARLIRAMIFACHTEPSLNAWYDSHSIGRRLLEQVHLGLAVDTKDGLFVPVIKDVAQLSAKQLTDKIAEIKTSVGNRTIAAEQLRGNSITLSNFGSIGGKYANPIVVPPTVAIVGAGRVFSQVVMIDAAVQEHHFLPLSLTFDHRAATGAEAARFMQALIKDLGAHD